MLPLDFEFTWTWFIYGLAGMLFFYGLFSAPAEPDIKVRVLLHEIDTLTKKNKHLTGTSRLTENANAHLQKTLRESDARMKESQLAQAKLNDEVVRRGNQIRSLERELYQERTKVTGRR